MRDINGVKIKVGQICKVHPSDNRPDGGVSVAREVFYVQIIRVYSVNWINLLHRIKSYLFGELYTNIPDAGSARINEYLLSRLEVIGGHEYSHYLYGQELYTHSDSLGCLLKKFIDSNP